MVWNNGTKHIDEQTHGVGYNVGQHVAMNRLLDEACRVNADYFVRVDEDCFFETKQWLKKMLYLQQKHLKIYNRICVLSPHVHGLRMPPKLISNLRIGKYRLEAVDILGGICRMAPMGLMRYWRFDERAAMGFGEARAFARHCMAKYIPMLRCNDIHISHGESTDAQESADPDWTYEHYMLQMMPYGL